MLLSKGLRIANALIMQRYYQSPTVTGQAGRSVLWLRLNLPVYLKGFLERGIRPQTGKNSHKVACGAHREPPFTIRSFTMVGPYAKQTMR